MEVSYQDPYGKNKSTSGTRTGNEIITSRLLAEWTSYELARTNRKAMKIPELTTRLKEQLQNIGWSKEDNYVISESLVRKLTKGKSVATHVDEYIIVNLGMYLQDYILSQMRLRDDEENYEEEYEDDEVNSDIDMTDEHFQSIMNSTLEFKEEENRPVYHVSQNSGRPCYRPSPKFG